MSGLSQSAGRMNLEKLHIGRYDLEIPGIGSLLIEGLSQCITDRNGC